ncbi:MAG: hypothetical protein ABSF32_07510 [Ignavibacteria bacterium]|jgi:hypothetical protein
MKNIKFIIFFALVFISVSIYSNPKHIPVFYNGDRDSLLFDGAEESSDVIKISDESCRIIVNYAVDASGEILKRKISNICGQRDTGWVAKHADTLKARDMLQEGTAVKTGPNGEISILLITGDSKADVITEFALGPNSTLNLPILTDLCTAMKKKLDIGQMKVDLKKGKILVNMGEKANQIIQDLHQLTHDVGLMVFNTANSIINDLHTQFSIEVSASGNDTADIIKVYEGKVKVSVPYTGQNKGEGKSKAQEMQQLTQDYKDGKITMEELQKKLKEETQNMVNTAENILPVTVEVGNKCTNSNGVLKVEPIESNDDRWWENIINK